MRQTGRKLLDKTDRRMAARTDEWTDRHACTPADVWWLNQQSFQQTKKLNCRDGRWADIQAAVGEVIYRQAGM